jgi:two-component system CheB/CheR fusion protein
MTERKKIEEALRRSEQRYRLAARATNDAIWDWDLVSDRIEWNEALSEIFGYPASDRVNSSGAWWKARIHPEDRNFVIERIHSVITDGEEAWSASYRFRRADGAYAEVFDRGWLVRDKNGQPLRMVGAMRDRDHWNTEAALRASEERFRQLADAMPQLVWTANPDGAVDYYNRRHRLYGGIAPTLEGNWEWSPVLHPDDLQLTMAAWDEALRSGQTYQIEHRVRMADGSYRWHLSRGIPTFDERGMLVKWYGTATDVHDFKAVQADLAEYAERLQRSNEELENFAFVASHDLQEPLRKIQMFGDLLHRQIDGQVGVDAGDYLERMQNAAERMQAMISGLLELSRVSTRGQEFAPVDLTDLAAEVVSDLEAQIRLTHGQVQVGPLPRVEGDALQLHRLLQNLLANALKFSRPDTPPRVHVSGQLEDTEKGRVARVVVTDNGIGFDPANAERLFQPFVRLHGRSQYEGSGMGLAICKKIVERHGGDITATATPGEGSRFTVTLPA